MQQQKKVTDPSPPICFRLPREHYERLAVLAKADGNRSVPSLLRIAVQQYLQRREQR
jgi:predicted DNA-binding protein